MRYLLTLINMMAMLTMATAQQHYYLDTRQHLIDSGVRYYGARPDTGKHNVIFYEQDKIVIVGDNPSSIDTLTDDVSGSTSIIRNVENLAPKFKNIVVGNPIEPGLYRINIHDSTLAGGNDWHLYVYSMPCTYDSIYEPNRLNSLLNPVFTGNIGDEIESFIDMMGLIMNCCIGKDAFNGKMNSAAANAGNADTNAVYNIAMIIDSNTYEGVIVSDSNIDIRDAGKTANWVAMLNSYFDTVLYSLTDTALYTSTFIAAIDRTNDTIKMTKMKFRDSVIAPFIARNKDLVTRWVTNELNHSIFLIQDYGHVARIIQKDDTQSGILFDFKRKYYTQMRLYAHICYPKSN